jgi:hypothetical protein
MKEKLKEELKENNPPEGTENPEGNESYLI